MAGTPARPHPAPRARAGAQAMCDEESPDHPIDVISGKRKQVTVEPWDEWVIRDRAHPQTTASVRANDHSSWGQEAWLVLVDARSRPGLPAPTTTPARSSLTAPASERP